VGHLLEEIGQRGAVRNGDAFGDERRRSAARSCRSAAVIAVAVVPSDCWDGASPSFPASACAAAM
jgi:hypothetical protein